MPSLRIQRVREVLKRAIGEILRREYPVDQGGLLTVNEVDVTADLQQATVYIGFVGTKDQRKRALERLEQDRRFIQAQVGQAVVLKYTPVLKFVPDEAIERGNRVLAILDELERDKPPS
jgi:ribosome-binding factor A